MSTINSKSYLILSDFFVSFATIFLGFLSGIALEKIFNKNKS